MTELVTVCLTTFNRKKMLKNAVESILKQSYQNFELLIIDDCSNDGTHEFVNNGILQMDDRIRYLRNDENQGLSSSRNVAIRAARGTFFTFMDDDDQWDEAYIEQFVDIARKLDESWCFCCGNKLVRNGSSECYAPDFEGALKDYIYNGFTPPVSAQFYYLKTLKNIDGYNENIASGVDHDLWIRLSVANIKLKTVSKCLSIPNIVFGDNRMTTNYKKRVVGIRKSLKLWEADIVRVYGKAFYTHFSTEYMFYIYKKYFVNAIRHKKYLLALFYLIKIPGKIRVFRVLLIKQKTPMTEGRYPVRPLFAPFKQV